MPEGLRSSFDMSDSDQSIAEYLAGPGGGGAFLPSKIAEDLADALVNENVCGFMFAKPAHPCGGMRAWGGVWGVGVFCLFVCSVRRRCAALPARGGVWRSPPLLSPTRQLRHQLVRRSGAQRARSPQCY